MIWEETIKHIRNHPEYADLVKNAYLDENLQLNVERFRESEEYKATLKLLQVYAPNAKTILDIGCGNGISSIAFALDGYTVAACEPDPSNTVGAGAVERLKQDYGISNLEVYQEYAEKINLSKAFFDIVYVRQAMHHAYDLDKFVQNLALMLKSKGVLITVRDHVIYNEPDKAKFLSNHPLQKFYGGENAFTELAYRSAMETAGLKIKKIIKYYDSVINYAPLTSDDVNTLIDEKEKALQQNLLKKIGFLGKNPFIIKMYKWKVGFKRNTIINEKDIPGRMYSFIAQQI